MSTMISQLTQGTRHNAIVEVPAPPSFRAPSGKIRNVTIEIKPPQRPHDYKNMSASRKNGVRYESRVQVELYMMFPDYNTNPVFEFRDDSGFRRCIPDGLLLYNDSAIIFEIKIQHMPEAWWQLKRLYEPVVAARFPGRRVRSIEIVKSYDPSMPFPCHCPVIDDLRDWVYTGKGDFAVYVCKV